jgi:aerobic carbon-monoxide dehydrogenase medium subunit
VVTYLEPTTLRAAAELRRSEEDSVFVSGGTAIVLMLQQGLIFPDALISLRGLTDVPGWTEVSRADGGLRIGAGVSLTEVARSPLVRDTAPSLAHAASLVGNVRVRNAATLGGNVAEADYASDPPSVLVDLGAEIEVSDGTTTRRVPAADMFVDFYTTALHDGEVVTAVHVPLPEPGTRCGYTKFSARSAEDRPCVGVAASLRLDGGTVAALSVVVGAVSGVPQRWPDLTGQVVGEVYRREVADRVAAGYADAADPIEDVRGSAWYRKEIVYALVRRAILELGSGHA